MMAVTATLADSRRKRRPAPNELARTPVEARSALSLIAAIYLLELLGTLID
jgi:hypothetical protein